MKKAWAGLAVVWGCCTPVLADDLGSFVDGLLPEWVATYKDLHAHPELSHHEGRTSALFAQELRKAGYTVAERVGKYPDGSQAYGVVGILKNGSGPQLLLRTDLDALPVVEETGLSYASHVRAQDPSGKDVGVMHACGHDIHVTNMMGTARALVALKSRWHGTLMIVGQPSEEMIDGAKAMLADNLYQRFGTPDLIVALHDTNLHEAGVVSIRSGPAMASSTSVDVVMRGVGGHGALPQQSKDPIVMSAEFVVQLQTIVSRQEDPLAPTVLTVGDIHGGTKRNIIPDEVKLELTARAFSDSSRQIMLDGIRRTAAAVAMSAGVPEDRAPIVTVIESESTPVLVNDPQLTGRVKEALAKALGARNVVEDPPMMASEDFGVLGLDGRIPTVMFNLGAMAPDRFAAAHSAGKLLPGLHSNHFEPLPEPTLRSGVTAMTSVAVALLQKQ